MSWLFFYVVFAVLVGVMANSKGRNILGYVLLSMLISPLIVFIILLIVGDTEQKKIEKEVRNQKIKELAAQQVNREQK